MAHVIAKTSVTTLVDAASSTPLFARSERSRAVFVRTLSATGHMIVGENRLAKPHIAKTRTTKNPERTLKASLARYVGPSISARNAGSQVFLARRTETELTASRCLSTLA